MSMTREDVELAEYARQQMDSLYSERARCVALAVAMAHEVGYPIGWRFDQDTPGWTVVMIGLPTGQVSWHLSDEDFLACFPNALPRFPDPWDGHDTASKYDRVLAHVSNIMQP